MNEDRYVINSVVRAAKILEAFSLETPTLSNAELSKILRINKSAITRLMHSLVKAGLVSRDETTGRYSLTHKLFRIGSVYVNNSSLHTIGRPLLEKLSSRFNENAQIGILDRAEVMYLEQVKCSQHIGLMSTSGSRLPSYCTGAGKVLLAYLTDDEFEEVCATADLKRYTPLTIVEPDKLREQMQKIRQAGYAIAKSEFQPDVISFAAPVFGENGKVIAAISLAGPVFRMDFPEKMEEFIQVVVDTAGEISEQVRVFKK